LIIATTKYFLLLLFSCTTFTINNLLCILLDLLTLRLFVLELSKEITHSVSSLTS